MADIILFRRYAHTFLSANGVTLLSTETLRCVAGLAGCLQAMGELVEAKTKYTIALEGFVR